MADQRFLSVFVIDGDSEAMIGVLSDVCGALPGRTSLDEEARKAVGQRTLFYQVAGRNRLDGQVRVVKGGLDAGSAFRT